MQYEDEDIYEAEDDGEGDYHTCTPGEICNCDDAGGGYKHYHCIICDCGMNMRNPEREYSEY